MSGPAPDTPATSVSLGSFWSKAGPFLLFASLGALVLPEVVFQHKVFIGVIDRVVSEIPFLKLASDSLRSGYLPLWNSYSLCGSMALGEHKLRFFYPPNLLISLLFPADIPAALSWRIVFDIVLQLCLYYLLFLKVFRDRATAAFASIAVSMSIQTISMLDGGHLPNIFVSLMLLVLWDWERRSMRLNVLYLAPAVFLHFASGHYQHAAYGLLLAFGVSAVRCLRGPGDRGRRLARLAFLWSAAFSLGVMLEALDYFPFLQAQQASNRVSTSYAGFMFREQPWYMSLRLLIPQFLGDWSNHSAVFSLAEGNTWVNVGEAFPVYSGAAAFLFCLAAARRWRRLDTLPWLGATLLISLCALRTPYGILPHLLFLKMPLGHNRLATVVPLCVAFLAGTGMQGYFESDRSERGRSLLLMTAFVALFYIAASGVLGERFWLLRWLPWRSFGAPDLPARFRAAADLFRACTLPLLIVLALHTWGKLRPGVARWACAGLLAADLAFMWRHHALITDFTPDIEWYPRSKVTRFLDALPDKELYRFHLTRSTPFLDIPLAHTYAPTVNLVHRIHEVGGYASFFNRQLSELLVKGADAGFIGMSPVDIADTPPMADLFGVKYIVAPNSPGGRATYGPLGREVLATPEALVIARPRAVPRFHLAYSCEDTPALAREFIQRIHAPGVSLADRVFLEPREDRRPGTPAYEKDPADDLRMAELRPGLLRGSARTRHGAWLVVSDTFDPGWRAWIDGRPARILRANYAFQAVELPAGPCEIMLRYRFDHFWLAAGCVVFSLAVLAGLALAPVLLRPGRRA